jgi:predicted nuclease of predicted toxin-antitoxin system
MRLLFDEHLSPRLVDLLDDLFPGSAHVHTLGLGSADDRVVFEHARNHGFCIVTKDSDFPDLALTQRQPPRILWLRVGNRSTASIATLLREQHEAIATFASTDGSTVLLLTAGS